MVLIEQYRSVNDLPESIWNILASHDAVSLESAHLRAVENSHINDISPYYFVGYSNNKPIGIAYCFLINVNLSKLANSYPPEVFNVVKAWNSNFMEIRMVEIGHIASVGSTIEIKPSYITEFLNEFSIKIDEIARLENADMCLIRDLTTKQFHEFQILKEFGYKSALGFPIARMAIHWDNLEAYIESLKSKKRNNLIRRYSKLNTSEITVEIIEDYAPYAEHLSELWTNVAKNNNGYEHEKLTPSYFKSMAHYLKGRSHVVAIKKHDTILAYGLNLIGDTEYFGMAEGLDYNFRNEYDLYVNNIFEALRMACELKKKTFNIGITAYDFKTSIGAELQPCIYLIKAFKKPCYSEVYADLIRKNIHQPYNKHRVFKNMDVSTRVQLNEIKEKLLSGKANPDPFIKHNNYVRTDTARAVGLYTYCPEFESAQEPVIRYNGRDVIMLGTNAYLGLSTHKKVLEAAHKAIDKYGSGCSGSPMLNGTLTLHKELSRELAKFMKKEDALVFSTGYQTSVGVISALVNRNDILIMDERNHASLVDGAILSRAKIVRYKHNYIESLETLLKKYENKPKLIVTDSLFSMEGTIINLPQIVQLAKKYNARLMLDESHAIGVMGPTGRGIAEHFGLLGEVDILMGTFSKSFASIGGFVVGNQKIIDALRHTSRAHIFSASLPPAAVATVLAAIKIIDDEPERRSQLIKNAKFLANGLQNLGYKINYYGNAILTIHCGHELIAVAAYKKLLEEGVFVNPVPNPAVPKNQELLRISLMATHNEEILQHALDIFKKIRTQYWPQRL